MAVASLPAKCDRLEPNSDHDTLSSMTFDLTVKLCGMTCENDVDLAVSMGADFIGFIVYPHSPRALTLKRAVELAERVPEGRRVIVDVETCADALLRYRDAGFDHFQIHAALPLDEQVLAGWSKTVGPERLWLAPRLPPHAAFPEWVLQHVNTILLDTYSKDQIGGTGHTGDFEHFATLKQQFADTRWILAGGLNPSNVVAAIERSTASRIDVNSGIEHSPGQKDPNKLRELFQVLELD